MNHTKILPADWEVPTPLRTRFGEQAGHQRMMTQAGHLLLVLHEPPAPGISERQARVFWRMPDGLWKVSDSSENGLKALQQHLHKYLYVIEKLERQLDSAKQAQDFFQILRTAAPLLRSVGHMHHTLQQARETFPDARELILGRDQAYQFERTLELLHTEAQHALNFMIAQHAEEQAQHGEQIAKFNYRLQLLAGFFLPLTTLATIFGMNFPQTMNYFDSFLTFWVVLIVGIALGVHLKRKV
jgi:Mg2+ and Co2+ transporter CorA